MMKVTNAYYEKDAAIFKEDKNIANLGPLFTEMTGMPVDAVAMRAWRFWASFLGFGYVIIVGAGTDAVDYKLISICHKGDIVVSQDYGVAAMALGKGAYAIHQSGKWYTDENIDQMLMERNLNKKARRGSHKNHIKGPRKRTEEDDVRFAQSFEKMIQTIIQIR